MINFTVRSLWEQDEKESCNDQPYVLSDQLDRWSRISLVKKVPIHYQRVPEQAGMGGKNVPECVI